MLSWFQAPPRVSGDGWFSVGLASSFPDIGADEVDGDLSQPRPCSTNQKPGCKVFHVPVTNSAERSEVPLIDGEVSDEQDLKDQVLVFRYRGKFHAIDHRCPHSSYPLSKGIPFDIEDFGVALSAGLTCPKHGWSFDLFSGMGDRGSYRLKIWETQLRDVVGAQVVGDSAKPELEKELWVRRKQRMG